MGGVCARVAHRGGGDGPTLRRARVVCRYQVIYVDADQVVRADLAELMDMDLQGKPYAYTPFCTSREETLGFQFWRQGYWKEHLRYAAALLRRCRRFQRMSP